MHTAAMVNAAAAENQGAVVSTKATPTAPQNNDFAAAGDFIPLTPINPNRGAAAAACGTTPGGHPNPHHPYNRTTPSSFYRNKRKRENSSNPVSCRNGDKNIPVVSAAAAPAPIDCDMKLLERITPTVRSPWTPPGRSYAQGIIGLHEEIEDYFQWMVPSQQEHELRLAVIGRIRSTVLELWPAARVEIFGSFRTGLYLPTSDIDLVICGKWPELPLRTLERALLEKKIAKSESLLVLDKAAVPIIKLKDHETDIKVDISFNMANGLRAAELIKYFKKRFPALSKLIYVLKQFLLQRDLNEVFSGGLSSYALILLMVNFLQNHPRQDASKPNVNLGVLLLEFLYTYGRAFNFMRYGIRVRDDGEVVPKEELQRNMPAGHQASLICIEDPLDASNDVGRSSYGAPHVLKAFETAFVQLAGLVRKEAEPPEDGRSILSNIIQVSDKVIAYRQWIAGLDTPPPAPQDPAPSSPSKNNAAASKATAGSSSNASSKQGVNSYVEFNHHPHHPPPTSYEDVEPKEISERMFEKEDSSPEEKESRSEEEEDEEEAKEDSDSLSSVSTGTSGAGSVVTNSSQTASDTDSDLLCQPSPSASPSSAMSISPATSEVGSLKSRLLGSSASTPRSAGSIKLDSAAFGAGKRGSGAAGTPGGKTGSKPTYWKNAKEKEKEASKSGESSADLDMNWRSSPGGGGGSGSSASPPAKVGAASSSSSSSTSSKRMGPDRDTNWRNHQPPARESSAAMSIQNGSASERQRQTAWKAGKKNKKQNAHKSGSKTPPPSVNTAKPSSTSSPSSSTEASAKERLTAGLIVNSNQNSGSNSLAQQQQDDNRPGSSNGNNKKAKNLTKKRKKKNNNGGGSVSGSGSMQQNDNGVVGSEQCFSGVSGLCGGAS